MSNKKSLTVVENDFDFMSVEFETEFQAQALPPVANILRGAFNNNPNELLNNGSFQFSVEQFGHIENQYITDVLHSNGTINPSYLLGNIGIAVLAYQQNWFLKDGDETTWLKHYEKGATSKMVVYAYCKETSGFILFSLKGFNAKFFGETLKTFRRVVIGKANNFARKQFPLFGFWLELKIGERTETPKNNYVTPPILATTVFDKNGIRKLFVGKVLMDTFESEMVSWVTKWAKVNYADEIEKTLELESGDDPETEEGFILEANNAKGDKFEF